MKDLEDGFKTTDGEPVYSYEYIEQLRAADKQKANPLKVIPQKGSQERFVGSNADLTFIGGNRGGGKLQPYESNICTPFGFRKMGDLKVGDIISNPIDGGMQRVLQVHEHGEKDIYRIFFSDGSYTECGLEHLWLVKRTNYKHKKRYINNVGQEVDWKIWDFAKIKDFLDRQGRGEFKTSQKNNLLIPLSAPVKFTKSGKYMDVGDIDPYLIGALIGDGCLSETIMQYGKVLLTSADEYIVEEFAKSGIEATSVQKKENTKAKGYFFEDQKLNEILERFHLRGSLSCSKFIPIQYKYGTIETRLALVQGLMDTDGYVDDRGHCFYTTISEQLAKDMQFIIQSLGGTATISRKKAGYKNDNGDYIQCADAFELYIKIANTEKLFRLPRKKNRCKMFNGGVSEPCRRITRYEYVGKKKCRCITVDDRNGLYLTDSFIVTHNSFAMLLEALRDINNRYFNAIIFRKEKKDFDNLEKESYHLYGQYGKYNKSLSDMTWNFHKGGSLAFSHFSDTVADFKERFRGKQYSYIAIDEIPQIEYAKFKYLMTCNRNARGIRNRMVGTCNPDPDSWVRKFIDWWIGEDGLPIAERDGVIRYCFMDGDTPDSIYWGDTPEEVYQQCKHIIDKHWKPEFEELGFDKITMYIKSVTFIRGKLEENIKLIGSDPNYVSSLVQQDEEQRSRDLDGNWNFKTSGDDLIKMSDMERFFNAPEQIERGIKYVSADIAFEGGDFCVMWLWVDLHIKDVFVMRENSANTEEMFVAKLREWGVREENVIYDYWGVGQALSGHVKRAVKFTGTQKPEKQYEYSYKNIKSQCAEMLAHYIQDGKISIDPRLLGLKFSGKKGKYQKVPLREILMKERKCIRHKDNSNIGGFELINKDGMIKAVGYSPDFFESLIYRMFFEINKRKKVFRPKGMLRYVSYKSY